MDPKNIILLDLAHENLVNWCDGHECGSTWLSGCPEKGNYSAKNTNKAFSALKWPISGQADNNIGWATSMPITSIYQISWAKSSNFFKIEN